MSQDGARVKLYHLSCLILGSLTVSPPATLYLMSVPSSARVPGEVKSTLLLKESAEVLEEHLGMEILCLFGKHNLLHSAT